MCADDVNGSVICLSTVPKVCVHVMTGIMIIKLSALLIENLLIENVHMISD